MITLAQAKAYLGVEHTDDDQMLTDALAMVRDGVADFTGLLLESESQTQLYDGGVGNIILLARPVATVSEVADVSGDSPDILDPGEYDVIEGAGLLFRLDESNWGAGRRRWRVTYTAGYNETTLVTPKSLNLAMLTWLADIYASRHDAPGESVGGHQLSRNAGIPDRVKSLLCRYRRI